MQLTAYCKGNFHALWRRGLLNRKGWMVMKLTTILLIAACLQVSAEGFSQRVTLNEKGAPLEKVFKEIKRQTGYLFVYRDEWLQQARKVDVAIQNGTLQEAIDLCLKDQPLTYTIVDKTVVIQLRPDKQAPPAPQPVDLKGKVIGDNYAPLEGATVSLRNAGKFDVTTEEGFFTLHNVAPGDYTLNIMMLGYQSFNEKINIDDKTVTLNIVLKQSTNILDRTVVIAYGTTTPRLNTGDVSKVTGDEIARQPVSNPVAALEGRVPGLIVTQTSGLPGAGFNVQIRGRNSIDNGSNPLYIVDGVPFNGSSLDNFNGGFGVTGQSPFNSIDPDAIESIEILKDADATAIYGSRGANGVILISTKKGQAGKSKFALSAYTGAGQITRSMNYLNTQQYLQIRHEAFANDGIAPDEVSAPDLLLWDTTRYTDWKKMLIGGTARITNIQANLSGGNETTQFLLGASYNKETTVFPGSLGDVRGGLHLNINHVTLNGKFSVMLSANYTNDRNNLIGTDLTQFINTAPDAPPAYNAEGHLNWVNGGFLNPMAFLLQTYSAITDNLLSNLNLKYRIFKGLTLNVDLGYTSTNLKQVNIMPKASQDPAYSPISTSFFGTNSFKSYIIEPKATYTTYVAGHRLELLAGTSWQQELTDGNFITATNYSSEALLNSAAGAATINVKPNYSLYRYQAAFGRINYNINNKYLLDLTGRRDGSSRFGPGKQFADFGAVGAGWIFSEETWVKKNLRFLSYGKFRGSYGTSGNDQIGNYQYLDTWKPAVAAGATPYQGTSGLQPSRLFNPDYAWEVNRKLEVSAEFGFAKDRIIISGNYFRNRSNNQLINYSVPGQTGFTSIIENFPAVVQNKGFEFMLTSQNIKGANFNWTTSFNISFIKNKLISFPGLEQSSYATSYVVGQSLNVLKLYEYTGVDPETGVYQFKGTSYPDDLTSIKDLTPSFYGGIENSIRYKRFDIDILFQFTKQQGRDYSFSNFGSAPGALYNQPTEILNRWRQPKDQTNIQKLTTTYTDAGLAYLTYVYQSDGTVTDASFIRLKNISVSYDVPPVWLKRLKIQQLKVFLHGQNLLTITNYKGNDPESGLSNSLGATALPPLKFITVGLQITF